MSFLLHASCAKISSCTWNWAIYPCHGFSFILLPSLDSVFCSIPFYVFVLFSSWLCHRLLHIIYTVFFFFCLQTRSNSSSFPSIKDYLICLCLYCICIGLFGDAGLRRLQYCNVIFARTQQQYDGNTTYGRETQSTYIAALRTT